MTLYLFGVKIIVHFDRRRPHILRSVVHGKSRRKIRCVILDHDHQHIGVHLIRILIDLVQHAIGPVPQHIIRFEDVPKFPMLQFRAEIIRIIQHLQDPAEELVFLPVRTFLILIHIDQHVLISNHIVRSLVAVTVGTVVERIDNFADLLIGIAHILQKSDKAHRRILREEELIQCRTSEDRFISCKEAALTVIRARRHTEILTHIELRTSLGDKARIVCRILRGV